MTKNKQKLELTWIGKGQEMNLEPRILVENPEKSYGAPNTENMLIHGDNLLALKALEQNYTGKIKCIYIDPPYNTGSAFEHYDDNVEHSKWLSLMKVRLEILHNLLSKDGVIFINLDENEHAYCKIICDEIFGRTNFLGDLIWQKRKGGGNDSYYFALDHDYILVYAKNSEKTFHPYKWRVSQNQEYLKRYKEIDSEGNRFYWDTLARDGLQNPIPVTVRCPDGTWLKINSQKSQETIELGLKNGSIRVVKTRNGWNLHHRVYMPKGQVLRSILTDLGTNKSAKEEITALFASAKSFDYPKPETLIMKLLELCTKKGDLVLDSFLGSGTTAAVAHKMGRKWIGIELRDHCYTHCEPRLQKVVDGTDQGGISKAVNWQGGGGYKFYELAPSLLKKDEFGNWIIDSRYDAEMLAEAMAKQEGYQFSPDEENIYKQGYSTEKDFIFTTTQFLSIELLDKIYSKLKADESLLICATHFEEGTGGRYDNITVKKIPQMLLNRCEFGKLEYNLNIIDPPQETEDDEETLEDE